mgnify:FL=1
MMERAYRLDPLVGINNGMRGLAYLMTGQFELGERHIERAEELGWRYIGASLLIARLARGEAKAVLDELDEFIESQGTDLSDFVRMQIKVLGEAIAGTMDAAEVYKLAQTLGTEESAMRFRTAYLVLGDFDRYFDSWEAAIDRGFIELYPFRYIYIPGGQAIVEHPRFLQVSERLGLIPFWQKHGYPMGCERVAADSGDRLRCDNWPE